MDTNTVVSHLFAEGRELLTRLSEGGFAIAVAGWVQRADDDRWVLFVATPRVVEGGPLAAYEEFLDALSAGPHEWLAANDIHLIRPDHPRAAELLRTREANGGKPRGRYLPMSLDGLPIKDAYVYPAVLKVELGESEKQVLLDLYAQCPLSADALPYTEEMEQLHNAFVQQTGLAISVGDLFRALINLRKKGQLPTKADRPAGVA
jgi:hypothetical protein